jgi:hypothetical protein
MTLMTVSNLLYKHNNSLNEKFIQPYVPPQDGEVWYIDSNGTGPTYSPNYESEYVVDRTDKAIRIFRIYEIKSGKITVVNPEHSFANKQLLDYEYGYLTAYFESMYQSGYIE